MADSRQDDATDRNETSETGDMEQLVAQIRARQAAVRVSLTPRYFTPEYDDRGQGASSYVWRWGLIGVLILLIAYVVFVIGITWGLDNGGRNKTPTFNWLHAGKWAGIVAGGGLVGGMIAGGIWELMLALRSRAARPARRIGRDAVHDPFADRFAERDLAAHAARRSSDSLRPVVNASEKYEEVEIEIVHETDQPDSADADRVERGVDVLRSGTLVGGTCAVCLALALLVYRMTQRTTHWDKNSTWIVLLIEFFFWFVAAIFIVGGGAFLGRMFGLLVALTQGWRRDVLYGDVLSVGQPRAPLTQYARWPVFGGVCVLSVYVILSFALDNRVARFGRDIPTAIGMLVGAAFAFVAGGVAGLALRGAFDFVGALAERSQEHREMSREVATRDPFSDRFDA